MKRANGIAPPAATISLRKTCISFWLCAASSAFGSGSAGFTVVWPFGGVEVIGYWRKGWQPVLLGIKELYWIFDV
ncbi:MAG: hypothetical protein HY081_05200 [Gammaproteobacteria bacterium]|nr:hypothetical protein [Gammaproteobacteria bacterium]